MSNGNLMKQLETLEQLQLNPKMENRKNNFYAFCQYIDPHFYKPSRPHLRDDCDILQSFYEGRLLKPNGTPYKGLMRNIPPRLGKTRTATLFNEWILGKNQTNRIMLASYNDKTAASFSKFTRDGLDEPRFQKVFPGVRVKDGSSSAMNWALEGQFFNFLGAGLGGSLTGSGCRIGLIDDPIKSSEEAFNANVLESQWDWYCGTWLSRIEEGGIQIITMTRWSDSDLCGRILESEDKDNWYVYSRPAIDDCGNMLCEELLSRERYNRLQAVMSQTDVGRSIFEANYNQKPINLEGALFKNLQTYIDYPNDIGRVIAYCDVADRGKDFLCCIAAGVREQNGRKHLYIRDILYDDKPAILTEPLTRELLIHNRVNTVHFESNSMGNIYSENVRKGLPQNVEVKAIPATTNKETRILNGSSGVILYCHFPKDWIIRWPEFAKALLSYQKSGKNKHDDAPDCLVGLAAMVENQQHGFAGLFQLYGEAIAAKNSQPVGAAATTAKLRAVLRERGIVVP